MFQDEGMGRWGKAWWVREHSRRGLRWWQALPPYPDFPPRVGYQAQVFSNLHLLKGRSSRCQVPVHIIPSKFVLTHTISHVYKKAHEETHSLGITQSKGEWAPLYQVVTALLLSNHLCTTAVPGHWETQDCTVSHSTKTALLSPTTLMIFMTHLFMIFMKQWLIGVFFFNWMVLIHCLIWS